jgi:hypothetical protein
MRHCRRSFNAVKIDGIGIVKLGKHGLSADGHPVTSEMSGTCPFSGRAGFESYHRGKKEHKKKAHL